MNQAKYGVLAACLLAVGVGSARAQDIGGGREIYEQQLRVQLDQQAPEAKEAAFDGGAWFNFAFFNYDDATAQKTRTLEQFNLRLWGRMDIQGYQKAYVRVLTGYDMWNHDTNPKPDGGDTTYHDPVIERAWYQFDLGKLLELNSGGKAPPVGFLTRVGRDYVELGTGFALSMPMDMVRFEVTTPQWNWMTFLGKTIDHSRNIIDSQDIYQRDNRCMVGTQLTYTGLAHHRPFVYFFNNDDHTQPLVANPLQKYQYDSRYVGLGSQGVLLPNVPNLLYGIEGVGEFGETFSAGSITDKDRIYAGAIDAMLQYLFDCKLHPHVGVEYMFGSGDRDRTLSATSIDGGNTQGTPDNAYNSFGYRDTGVAFAPRVSNLHIYSANAGFFPLEDIPLFKKMEWGVKLFFYQKAVNGAISDPTATNASQWVGWESDIYCDWRITSDVTWSIRYGAFQPGDAFTSGQTRNFIYTGLTYSF